MSRPNSNRRVMFAVGCSLGTVALVAMLLVRPVESNNSTKPLVLEGVLTISTTEDGKWSLVTMPSKENDKPLTAAFAIQYRKPVGERVEYKGQGTLEATDTALRVRPSSGAGWLFVVDGYASLLQPKGFRPRRVVGIAKHGGWKPGTEGAPLSHAEFLDYLKLDDEIEAECPSGGPGASQCSYSWPGGGSCSVTCTSGTYACCKKNSCTCVSTN